MDVVIKDLCARLPYGVKVQVYDGIYKINTISTNGLISLEDFPYGCSIDIVKPYLFPLDPLPPHLEKEYYELGYADETVDWCNANHIDYRDLIKKGLAIDATNLNIY